MSALAGLGAPFVHLARTVRAARRRGVPGREVLRELHDAANRTAPLVVGGMLFFGAVMIAIAHAQAVRLIGSIALMGPPYFELLVREFGPVVASVLAAARLGASQSAELATRTIGEQTEALVLSAGDPLAEWVAPRVIAGAIAVPALYILGTAAAAFSAAATATWAFGADGRNFLDPRFVDLADLACGGLKAFACGVFIPLAATQRGLAARGGTPAIGEATTDAVVRATFGCLLIDLFAAYAFNTLGL
jgi:phospholipid/cholesterol/gamma-HCH transport system permease protein